MSVFTFIADEYLSPKIVYTHRIWS